METGIFFIIGLIMITDLCDTGSQLCLKATINSINAPVNSVKQAISFFFRLLQFPRLWLSFSFTVISLMVWLFVLSRTDLNLAFSIDSMRYIFIAFFSMVILKERIMAMRWLGILSIVFGIILVALTR